MRTIKEIQAEYEKEGFGGRIDNDFEALDNNGVTGFSNRKHIVMVYDMTDTDVTFRIFSENSYKDVTNRL